MAEVLGAVASGLAIAEVGLKVGGTVWKLRRLWQQVHEVPETIQDLMRQIEMMDPILSDHEANLAIHSTAPLRHPPVYNAASAIQSAAYCREALGDLRRLVDDLDGAVESEKRSRRTLARMRVMLKKDTIKGFQDRLERAIRLLQWAQVNYLAANATITGAMLADMWGSMTEMQSQQNLIFQQLSNNNPSSSIGISPFPVVTQHDETSGHTIDEQNRVQRQRQGNSIHMPWSKPSIFGAIVVRTSKTNSDSQATYAARIQLPKWLSQKIWDISVDWACSGWQGSLSTWNIVPEDSPGMLCVKKGDLDGLLDLFNRRLASPQDCDAYGNTVFSIACVSSHTHIVNHLINMNLGLTDAKVMGLWSSYSILQGTMPINIMRQLSSRGFFHPLAKAAEDLEFQGESWLPSFYTILSASCLSIASHREELFELCFRTYFPFWNDLPPRRKQLMAQLSILFHDKTWTVDGLRHIICPDGPIRPVDTKAWNDDGVSYLHTISTYYLLHVFKVDAGESKTLLEEAIQATDDVHRVFYPKLGEFVGEGPWSAFQEAVMMSLFVNFQVMGTPLNGMTVRGSLESITVALQSLVSVIASCGYDLLEFGRQEAMTWGGRCSADSIAGDALYLGIRCQCDEVYEVKAVHYGAEPRDWYFEWEYHYEEYAGPFWNLIENPHLFMMPGSWVD